MYLPDVYHCEVRRVVAADDRELLFRILSYITISVKV